MGIFSRAEQIFGQDGMKSLGEASVAVFGIGGVGGYVAEMLARSGVGHITLFDSDTVSETNRNRQIIALESTEGMLKTEAMAKRILDINPLAQVERVNVFYTSDNADKYPLGGYTYIADCIDTMSSKIELISRAKAAGVPIISAMGAGNKLDPTRLEATDIYKTSVCPLARTLRRELRLRGIKELRVVYSREEPLRLTADNSNGRHAPASAVFVPAAMGIMIAKLIVCDISGLETA